MHGEVQASIRACTNNLLRCTKYEVHDRVRKHDFKCTKKRVPRFLTLEAMLVYFLCKNGNPSGKSRRLPPPLPPLFPAILLNRDPVTPRRLFWQFGRMLNHSSPNRTGRRGAHYGRDKEEWVVGISCRVNMTSPWVLSQGCISELSQAH